MSASSQTGPACQPVLASIAAYLDGELDAVACANVERHCDTCPSCAALVDSLRLTVGLCRQAAAVTLPEDVRRRARERVERLLAEKPDRRDEAD